MRTSLSRAVLALVAVVSLGQALPAQACIGCGGFSSLAEPANLSPIPGRSADGEPVRNRLRSPRTPRVPSGALVAVPNPPAPARVALAPDPATVAAAPSSSAIRGSRIVDSTAYCLTGTMASGRRVYSGAVAMNGVALGSRYRVLSGPAAGRTLTVEDRIGHGSDFDIAMPGACQDALNYGRRSIRIAPA